MTRVRHVKISHKVFVGLDACMNALMRPAMYDAYHHCTIVPISARQLEPCLVDIVGYLCENNDRFAVDRVLPVRPQSGDMVLIHDTGAHGHAMGFNYNGALRPAELWYSRARGGVAAAEIIRRAETMTDLFATLDFPGLALSSLD